MRSDPLSAQSMAFAVSIISLVKELKSKRESIISNQIGRSGTSIGANIREAHYAHGKADFIAKLQIALKEANETGYWLELLFQTGYIDEETYRSMDHACTGLRVMLLQQGLGLLTVRAVLAAGGAIMGTFAHSDLLFLVAIQYK